jgi:hypothetical protein
MRVERTSCVERRQLVSSETRDKPPLQEVTPEVRRLLVFELHSLHVRMGMEVSQFKGTGDCTYLSICAQSPLLVCELLLSGSKTIITREEGRNEGGGTRPHHCDGTRSNTMQRGIRSLHEEALSTTVVDSLRLFGGCHL